MSITDSPQRIARREIAWGLLVFLVAVFVRVHYVASIEGYTPYRSDAAKYVLIALNLHNFGIYSSQYAEAPGPEADAFISPGYPLLIYVFRTFTEDFTVLFYALVGFQALTGALSALLVLAIGRRLMPFGLALAPAFLTALAPHQVVSTGYLLTENWHAFLVLLGLWVLLRGFESERAATWFLGGVVLGAAALTRPVFTTVAVAMVLGMVYQRNLFAHRHLVLAYATGLALLLVPWQVYQRTVPDSDRSLARNVVMLGSYPDMTWKDSAHRGYPNREDPQFAVATRDWETLLATIRDRAREKPAEYLYWYAIGKPAMLWSWDLVQGTGGVFIYEVQRHVYNTVHAYRQVYAGFRRAHPVLMTIALLFALGVCLRFLASRDLGPDGLAIAMLAGLPVVITLVHVPLAGLPRYAVPYHPVMYCLACLAPWSAYSGFAALRDNR